jgi:CRISPR-associated protein Cmr3
MSAMTLKLTPRDPLIARDGRPFGAGQGNRMRGLSWPLPSVVAGSFRTALVKANRNLSFDGDMPQRLMKIEVAGVFPAVGRELYLPAPCDCLWDEKTNVVHRVQPVPLGHGEGVDFPLGGLDPVRLADDQAKTDFKPKPAPPWWPIGELTEWLLGPLGKPVAFHKEFLNAAAMETRDHVCLDAATGTAAEGQIYATSGLNVTHLPRFGVAESKLFRERFVEITLSARVTVAEEAFEHVEHLNAWSPLGGERRLVHWQRHETAGWNCPEAIRAALKTATRLRMVLATPAIFDHGWRPGWLDASTLAGRPIASGPTMKLVGLSNLRWKAVSGWSLAPPRGPKAIRRMVPAGSVYFFEVKQGEAAALADQWLKPVSDREQERRDGFGLAVWGTW